LLPANEIKLINKPGGKVKIVNWASNILAYGAMAAAAILMLITVADVGGRYLFNHPILGATEITIFLMVCLLLGMAPCALDERHVKIDIFVRRFSGRTQAILDCIYFFVGLFIVAILSTSAFKHSLLALNFDTRSAMLRIPDFPFILLLSISYAILLLSVIVILIKRIRVVLKK
jgi:TRAP-type transport system small permease protein